MSLAPVFTVGESGGSELYERSCSSIVEHVGGDVLSVTLAHSGDDGCSTVMLVGVIQGTVDRKV